MPNEFNGYPADNIKVSFKQIGDLHFLSKIETGNGAYNIPVPHSATVVAGVKQHGDMSASGTNLNIDLLTGALAAKQHTSTPCLSSVVTSMSCRTGNILT